MTTRPWIAIFDLSVTRNSPAGSCVLEEVLGLSNEFDITVFSGAFDNIHPERIKSALVPLPSKPIFLRYMIFHLLAPIIFKQHVKKRGSKPLLIQTTQGQFIGADISYPHFCHKFYLNTLWKKQEVKGLRRLARWINYKYNAIFEQIAFKHARWVVAPSQGLINELEQIYPFLRGRMLQIPNPVDTESFSCPDNFNINEFRKTLGVDSKCKVLCFAALGDFSRKGLYLIMLALADLPSNKYILLVVGGSDSEISIFQDKAKKIGIEKHVKFVGYKKNIRPFFWSSDLFVFPSSYEIFPLVVIQAMSAGLVPIVTPLNGVEEYASNGKNAWIIERNPKAIYDSILNAFSDKNRLHKMEIAAKKIANKYSIQHFVLNWRIFLKKILAEKL